MDDESKRTIALNETQAKVFEWIKAGCPDGIFPDDSFSHRVSARTLHSRGLIRISGRGASWNAELTERGKLWPAATKEDAVSRQIRLTVTRNADQAAMRADSTPVPLPAKSMRKQRSKPTAAELAVRDLAAAEETIQKVLDAESQEHMNTDLNIGLRELQRYISLSIEGSNRPYGKRLTSRQLVGMAVRKKRSISFPTSVAL